MSHLAKIKALESLCFFLESLRAESPFLPFPESKACAYGPFLYLQCQQHDISLFVLHLLFPMTISMKGSPLLRTCVIRLGPPGKS